jgi:ABC-type multidrug transport system ATPase subunit
MDEPVSALDPRMMQQVVGMLQRHRSRTGGGTLVTILHQMAAAEQLADRVMVIDDARMKAFGTFSEVLQAT